jgi:hypothetical protein
MIVWSVLFLVLGLANALAQTQQSPLGEKDNPELIGKRDINSGATTQMQIPETIARRL